MVLTWLPVSHQISKLDTPVMRRNHVAATATAPGPCTQQKTKNQTITRSATQRHKTKMTGSFP